MKRFLGILMVLLLSPLAYLYAEKNLTEVYAQWNEYQSTAASNEDQLTAGVYDSGAEGFPIDSTDVSNNQDSIPASSENVAEELIPDSMTNEGADNVAINTEPSGSNATDNQSVQEEHTPVKFSVDTILGGVGKGMIDGDVSKAKISNVLEMAVDGNNDIFFIDKGYYTGNEYSDTRYLRKLSADSKIVETAIIKKDMLNEDELKSPKRILYDRASDSIFILCDDAYERYLALFQMDVNNINTAMKIIPLSDKFNIHGEAWSIFSFASEDSFVLHSNNSGGYPLTYEVSKTGEVEKIEGLLGYGVKAVIPNSDGMFVAYVDSSHYYEGRVLKLAYVQFFPRKSTDIELTLSVENFSATAHNGAFYALTSKGIYKIDTDGKVSVFIDFKDLNFNDGNSGNYSEFAFDNDGNVIIFDYSSGSLRRINMN